jgi:hypothetical protein
MTTFNNDSMPSTVDLSATSGDPRDDGELRAAAPFPAPADEASATSEGTERSDRADDELSAPSEQREPADTTPHPTIARRIIFDGNAFDIPHGTPDVIVRDNNALRRAYATAMAKPELTQAQMEDGTVEIDGYCVPTLTLRVRPQVKGVSPADAPSLLAVLQRVPRVLNRNDGDDELVRLLLRGERITIDQAVRHSLGDRCDRVAHPPSTTTYGGIRLCSTLDALPAVGGAAGADIA